MKKMPIAVMTDVPKSDAPPRASLSYHGTPKFYQKISDGSGGLAYAHQNPLSVQQPQKIPRRYFKTGFH